MTTSATLYGTVVMLCDTPTKALHSTKARMGLPISNAENKPDVNARTGTLTKIG